MDVRGNAEGLSLSTGAVAISNRVEELLEKWRNMTSRQLILRFHTRVFPFNSTSI